jgi:CheY-like chemotaxis protein
MRKYMLIDDDEIFNFLNKRILELSGTDGKISVYTSAQNALKWLKDSIGEKDAWPEIILLDIRMPIMDGFAFLDGFMQLPAEKIRMVKVFMLTSSLDEKDRKRSASYPVVYGYYSKPMTPEILREMDAMPLKDLTTT